MLLRKIPAYSFHTPNHISGLTIMGISPGCGEARSDESAFALWDLHPLLSMSMDFSHSTLLEIASYQHSIKHAFRRGQLVLNLVQQNTLHRTSGLSI